MVSCSLEAGEIAVNTYRHVKISPVWYAGIRRYRFPIPRDFAQSRCRAVTIRRTPSKILGSNFAHTQSS